MPADRLCDDNEVIVGLLVEREEGLQKDTVIGTGPKRPVHVIRLQLRLGKIHLLNLPLALPKQELYNHHQEYNR